MLQTNAPDMFPANKMWRIPPVSSVFRHVPASREWPVASCLLFALLAMLCAAPCHAFASPPASADGLPSVAFYYGLDPPINALQGFDWIVVDGNARLPAAVSGLGPGQQGSTYFGYVSVGEVTGAADAPNPPPANCVIGQNGVWKSRILDLRVASCRAWLFTQRVAPMITRGFSHFFLDTLDSYELVLTAPEQRLAYQAGIVALIERIRTQLPQAEFILNRGFTLLDSLRHQGVVGVAAESLYRGWDQASQRYVKVKPADTAWLEQQLSAVRSRGLVPIAIDYVADDQPDTARQTAGQIVTDGFVPYVTNAQLNRVGVGAVTPEPREILMLYDGAASPMNTNVNWYAAMVLNHMGYATRALDVDTQTLPDVPMKGRIAGVVTWFSGNALKRSEAVYRWLRRQMDAGVPVAVLDDFGFPADARHLAPLGLTAGPEPSSGLKAITVSSHDPSLMGFETPALAQPDGFTPLQLTHGSAGLTLARDGQQETAVAITAWGGYALSPYVVAYLPQGTLNKSQSRARWILNPFAFFQQALRLGKLPAFDTTTASGNRLLFAHFDGDGFASASFVPKYWNQPAAKVILDAILMRYRIPTAASVIAGEFVDGGLYGPQHLAIYRPIARAIFALPWVEIGSHTYSHPFNWRALEQDPALSAGVHIEPGGPAGERGEYVNAPGMKYGYNLPVPGYTFSPQQEVDGSVSIINDLLAPPGKKVTLYQWSGDTDPDAEVVGLTYKAGLLNINGNNSTIDEQSSSLTNVVPLGVWKGHYFQVYAPDANEDQFTHDWALPYCGYKKVLQTFHMTESPRRLAPINIYYHFYSGTRPCGLAALESVYDWAIRQPTTPVFPSYYSKIALGFEYAGIARDGDAYVLGGYGADQTVRIAQSRGYPDFARSRNIAGFDDANQSRYISLGPDRARLVLTATPPTEPYLVSANAPVTALTRRHGAFALTLAGHVPLRLTLANSRTCQIRFEGHPASTVADGNRRQFSSPLVGGRLEVECPH